MNNKQIQLYLSNGFDEIIHQISEQFGSASVDRLSDYLNGFIGKSNSKPTHPLQKPRLVFFPGLNNTPLINPKTYDSTYALSNLLNKNFHKIKMEFSALDKELSSYSSSNLFNNLNPGDWSSFSLWSRGKFDDNIKYFPTLHKIITEIEGVLFPWRGEVTVLRLKGGAWLPEHYDWTNAQITCHLGINIPNDCGLIVAGNECKWEEGKTIFFDHSYLHSAYNNSSSNRDILLVNLLHPELTEAEIAGIKLIGPILKGLQ
ncbi:aspartyl/asparaginyl beta-hydroxylase domain-containing protein [Erwiniaceae bacterium L1_55_4]|nr:aspartyl/asparaginyl beta-hydroxylase domain-containing protein [Erwiniaceae bacterium L1_55_4]